MKTTLVLTAAILSSHFLFAQTPADTSKIQIGQTRVLIVDASDSSEASRPVGLDTTSALTHWSGIDLGVNFIVNENNSTNLGEGNEWLDLQYERSLSWRFNLLEHKVKLIDEYVGLVTGLGLTYNSYGFRREVTVFSNTKALPDTTFGVIDSVIQFNKTKLRVTYVHVPLMLEFNTSKNPKRSFHVAAGVIGGWKISSITKQKFESEGTEHIVRRSQDFNLTPWTLDATARVGYRNFTAFITYGITPLFKDGKGPEVYPVTVGITVVPG